jgi:carbonic anhydrase/acetyltransferase-like protein (isoleucine patch superfamily)
MPLHDKIPMHHPTSFVAPSATLVGDVNMFDYASVWYGAVLRADRRAIQLGAYARVHENCVIDTSFSDLDHDHDGSVVIGHYVTIGRAVYLSLSLSLSEVVCVLVCTWAFFVC